MKHRAIHIEWEKSEVELSSGGKLKFYLGGPKWND